MSKKNRNKKKETKEQERSKAGGRNGNPFQFVIDLELEWGCISGKISAHTTGAYWQEEKV